MQLMYGFSQMLCLGSLSSLIVLQATRVAAITVSEPRVWRPSLRAHTTNLLEGPNFEAYKKLAKGPPSPGPGPPTSYDKPYDACLGCIRFYPGMKEIEGQEPDECRYGPCDFRDPQTQPWGGVIGGGSEADPESGWYKPALPLVCFTLSDISWYNNCDEVLYKEATTVYQVSIACEYIEQVNVLGPFLGATEPFMRLSDVRKDEQCGKVIEDGWTLYDDKDSFNSNLEALHACCETVHQYFTCVGDRKDILMGDHMGLMKLDEVANKTVADFSLFCVPMYRFPTKEEFCGAFPTSDPCVVYDGCVGCTEHGGVWCPEQKTCTKTGYEWCIRDPAVCDVPKPKKPKAPAPPAPAAPAPAPPDAHPDWYWQIVRAARLTNKSEEWTNKSKEVANMRYAVPYWTETNWTEWTSNFYINNPVQLVKQGKPVLFGPHALKEAEEEKKEKEEE